MANEFIGIPEEFHDFLGMFGPQLYDGWCGEPIMWGYPIIKHCDEEVWSQLAKLGRLECSYPNWYLITRVLNRKEAIDLYGEVTSEEFGPRGGWKTVTFGEKRFSSKELRA